MSLTQIDYLDCKINKLVELNMDYSADLETNPAINGVQYVNAITDGAFTIESGSNPDRVEITQNSIGILNPISGRLNSITSSGELTLTTLDNTTYLQLTPLQLNLNGTSGTAGQVLKKSDPADVIEWGNAPFVPTATEALEMGVFPINFTDVPNDSTATINALQLLITDGVSGIQNSMTNVNSTLLSGDGFKEVATTPENIILSDTEFTLTKNTITKDDMTFAFGLDDRATYGRTGIALQNGALPNSLQISQDSILLSTVGKSIEITQEDIIVDTLAGTSNQVLKKNDTTNVLEWGASPFVPTATEDLDMDTYGIINVGNIDAEIGVAVNMNGQFVFDTPPHCDDAPILGNDLTNKGYVDSLVGQYGGSLNLFFNYSQTASSPPSGYKQLSPTITAVASTAVSTATSGSSETLVASFITTPLNLDSLPAGVWSGNFNGSTDNVNASVSYVMRVYKYTIGNVETEIGTGAQSTIINTLATADYYAYLVVPTTALALTDRLVVKIFVLKSAGGSSVTITTNFEGDFYSYVSSSLNAGTTLLTSNNVWSGSNNFEALGIKSTSVDSDTTLSLGTGTATTTTLGRATQTTNINGATTTITSTTINLTGNVKTANIDTASPGTLNIGNATTTDLTLGRSGLANARITANNITLTGAVSGITTLGTSGVATLNSVASATYNSTNTTTACAILNTNTAQVDILTTSRTATTNMLTGTGANTFNLGSGATGLSFVVGGLVSTFNSASVQFANAIRGTLTTLGISQPVVPTGINYTAIGTISTSPFTYGTGVISNGSVGTCIVQSQGTPSIPNGSQVSLARIPLPALGVYLIMATFSLQSSTIATNDSILLTIGFGAETSTGQEIAGYRLAKLSFASSIGGGRLSEFCYTIPFVYNSISFIHYQ